MATTTFNTRISLKYDTYANWVEKDPVLLAGELGGCRCACRHRGCG